MRLRSFGMSLCAVALAAAGLFAQGSALTAGAVRSGLQSRSESVAPARTEPQHTTRTDDKDTAVIFMKADWVTRRQIDTARVTCFTGNFAAHHNGTIITADSAVRYSDSYVECFGNVLINKNTTYIYGDRADYDSSAEVARVYSPLVKVVDGNAVLYTYNFSFNTGTNIGTYSGGGMVIDRDNRLESVRGYYNADYHEVTCVEQVEISGDSYLMRGDSVVYNTDTENVLYFGNSDIWNDKGDYLNADRGEYIRAEDLYRATSRGYILTEKYEMWSDSIDYYRTEGHAIMRRDIQLDDTEHQTLGFGDYGEYWEPDGRALLTLRPSLVNYDKSQSDTLYMRSDTMYIYTVTADSLPAVTSGDVADTVAAGVADDMSHDQLHDGPHVTDSGAIAADEHEAAAGGPSGNGDAEGGQRVPSEDSDAVAAADSVALTTVGAADSLAVDTAAVHVLSRDELKARQREEAARLKAERRAETQRARKERLDRIAAARLAKLRQQKERDEAAAAERHARTVEQMKRRAERENARRAKKGLPPVELVLPEAPGLPAAEDAAIAADSIAADSVIMAADTLVAADTTRADSVRRIVRCYRDVRIYRNDFQALCDSLVAFSADSTVHMHIRPVLWNGENQVTSEVMDIYTAGGMIRRAEFIGRPMMVSQLDTVNYNQVTGKTMTAYFDEDGNIYRNDVNGNVETVYYIQDSDGGEITDALYLTSGDATYYIAARQVETITYRTDADGQLSPINMVPEEQITRLDGFEWRGGERPDKADVFDRTIRPSQRERVAGLKQPEFPISQRINAYRESLTMHRIWLDRVDVLSPEDEEWRRETLAAPYR